MFMEGAHPCVSSPIRTEPLDLGFRGFEPRTLTVTVTPA